MTALLQERKCYAQIIFITEIVLIGTNFLSNFPTSGHFIKNKIRKSGHVQVPSLAVTFHYIVAGKISLKFFSYLLTIFPDTLKSLETALIRKYLARRRWHRWFNAIKAMNRMKSFMGSVKHEDDENTNEPVEELHSK